MEESLLQQPWPSNNGVANSRRVRRKRILFAEAFPPAGGPRAVDVPVGNSGMPERSARLITSMPGGIENNRPAAVALLWLA